MKWGPFEEPKRLAVTNIGRRPVRRLGVVFEPERSARGRDGKPIKVPAPTVVIEVRSADEELQVRACKSLSIEYLHGEPFRAVSGGSRLAADLRLRAEALLEQATRLEAK